MSTELRDQIVHSLHGVMEAVASPIGRLSVNRLADAVMAKVAPVVEQLRQAEVSRDAYRDERDATQRERDEARASVERLRGDYRRIRRDRDRLLLEWRSARRRANEVAWLHAEAVWNWRHLADRHDRALEREHALRASAVDREVLVRLSAVALNGHVERHAMTRWDTTAERVVDALIAAGYVCTPGHEWQCPGCGATTRARMADYPTERDGAAQIAAERRRVVTEEGYGAAHDDQHTHGELLDAARCYFNQGHTYFAEHTNAFGIDAYSMYDQNWPWWSGDQPAGWKPSSNPVRNLVKAGQFVAAEIDRLQRAERGDLS